MSRLRSSSKAAFALGIVGLCLVLPVAPAGAKQVKPKPVGAKALDLAVSPAKPKVTDTLTVTFRAGKLKRGERYVVNIAAIATAGDCTSGYSVQLRHAKRPGQLVRLHLDPFGTNGIRNTVPSVTYGRFCEGAATVDVGRTDVDANAHRIVARRFTFTSDPVHPAPAPAPAGVPVRITVLDGSSLLAQAAGRPDRTLGLGGVLRGAIPGRFQPNSDIAVANITGALWLRSLTVDPLCAGGTFLPELALRADGASNMVLKASGDGSLNLALGVDQIALAGCAAPAGGSTNLALAGHVGPDGLATLALSGSVTGVPVGGGATATVTASLKVNVDLSGKG